MSIDAPTPEFEETIVVGGVKWAHWALADDRRWTLRMIAVVILLSLGGAVLGAKLASDEARRLQTAASPALSVTYSASPVLQRKPGQVVRADDFVTN